jgi:uncharacterized protein (TIGR00299 family) protein
MHIHLDVVGGISGDMFIGALLDCFPELNDRLNDQIARAGFSDLVKLSCEPADDGVLTGTKFNVAPAEDAEGHGHRHFSEIKEIINQSELGSSTKQAALAIFQLIGEAEASIHGIAIDKIAFHEVGAWDSIADIVSAAYLISELPVTSWSASTLPLGRGQVKTAHGMLPVPAPATSLLLEGFEFFDDGIEGERITPTGAAILKYLEPSRGLIASGGRLVHSGFGFGTRRFPGISNVLRLLVFDTAETESWLSDQVLEIEFEVDDQTGEELANALDRIRQFKGVLDVLQKPAFGKKGRPVSAISILGKPEVESDLIRLCFEETTTIGIRKQLVKRSILKREQIIVDHQDGSYRVKVVQRPTHTSAKAEMDDISTMKGGLAAKQKLRKRIEDIAETEFNKQHPDE